ncbi:MAG TPA: hypothetical protein VEA19_07770 [Actinomycetota bacterium]|nr:hypothetical protein [Actinomycetota bacterium]
MERERVATRLAIAAVIAALVGAIALLVLPGYTEHRIQAVVPGEEPPPSPQIGTRTLLEVNGPRVLLLFAVPVVLALAGLLRRRDARVIVSVFLWLFVVAGAVTFGLYFVPAAASMTMAAVKTPGRAPAV